MIRERSLRVVCLQGRRIACDRCRKSFTYVVEEITRLASHGVTLFSSDEDLQKGIARGGRRWYRELDRRERAGMARCPHCRRTPSWMLARARLRGAALWGIPTLGLSVAFSLLMSVGRREGASPAPYFLVPIGLAAAAAGFSLLRSGSSAPSKEEFDPLSATDEEVRRLLRIAAATDADPLREWYLSFHETEPADSVLVSIGFKDQTGEGFFPEGTTTKAILAEE
jgi:hypothetical protein